MKEQFCGNSLGPIDECRARFTIQHTNLEEGARIQIQIFLDGVGWGRGWGLACGLCGWVCGLVCCAVVLLVFSRHLNNSAHVSPVLAVKGILLARGGIA